MVDRQGLPQRLKLLYEGCGKSWKAMARWTKVSDVSLKHWTEDGLSPLESKLEELCDNAGLSRKWLIEGIGDAAAEVNKCEQPPAKAPKIREGAPSIEPLAKFIDEHGEEGEVSMTLGALESVVRRIQERQAASGPGRRHVKY